MDSEGEDGEIRGKILEELKELRRGRGMDLDKLQEAVALKGRLQGTNQARMEKISELVANIGSPERRRAVSVALNLSDAPVSVTRRREKHASSEGVSVDSIEYRENRGLEDLVGLVLAVQNKPRVVPKMDVGKDRVTFRDSLLELESFAPESGSQQTIKFSLVEQSYWQSIRIHVSHDLDWWHGGEGAQWAMRIAIGDFLLFLGSIPDWSSDRSLTVALQFHGPGESMTVPQVCVESASTKQVLEVPRNGTLEVVTRPDPDRIRGDSELRLILWFEPKDYFDMSPFKKAARDAEQREPVFESPAVASPAEMERYGLELMESLGLKPRQQPSP